MWPPPIKLADLLELAAQRKVPPGWLYLPDDWRTWKAETPAYMLDGDLEQLEAEAAETGYASTIEAPTVEDVVQHVQDVFGNHSFAARLEALRYYHRFDNVLPALGAPDPPPPEVMMLQFDREFYDSLGHERPDVRCKAAGCERGAVALSVLCRTHHFEQVHRRPCPFHN
jgi:hypothetical protein